ncbi:TetR/AcrR family transcriptional regulator [uncultured Jatrophihabitans sp.]|uniref:TetR/AcrR family transcriptional regulator n=1 Tax=uncultured Jatrophihabitans sp. TaxID=1610747 RepID=UPI0035CC44E9
MSDDRPYHHGALREAVISAAVAEVEAVGATAVSMREIARRAGVSHAAPAHHFGDRAGIFTAIATQGFTLAAESIAPAAVGPYGFLDGGAAYVAFAVTHPGHFEVMFRPALYREDDAQLMAARDRAFTILFGSARELAHEHGHGDPDALVAAGWSLSHGLATLLLTGNIARYLADSQADLADVVARGLTALGAIAGSRHA